jgi:Eukaryotic aspartyl protease
VGLLVFKYLISSEVILGTVQGAPSVPTVTDNLLSQGVISTETIGISYIPSTSASEVPNGEMTFGGTDPAKYVDCNRFFVCHSNCWRIRYTGSISYVPITQTSPANKYWGIDQTVTYGTSTPILTNSAGIVDTGTTLLLIATDAFQAYQNATGAVMDQ